MNATGARTYVEVRGEVTEAYKDLLTPSALSFLAKLERTFGAERNRLLQRREARQREIDGGRLPDFLPETAGIRSGNWTIGIVPDDLLDRRVEITGPAGDRRGVDRALKSGAQVFMADFEDGNSPTWANTMDGQRNLRDAVRRTIRCEDEKGEATAPGGKLATLIVRPRGWHLEEKHVLIDDFPVSASLFDFGLYLFHNAETLLLQGSGPYYYLPKLESHLEARLWNDVFEFSERELGIAQGAIKATLLIETILAAFEMDEMLFELKDRAVGLNCGKWDYIFSYIKKLRSQPESILPDRDTLTMESPFMRAFSRLAIRTCRKRGARCIGGMVDEIPVKHDPAANEGAIAELRAGKLRKACNGYDGTWVAHPDLVEVVREAFGGPMTGSDQHEKPAENFEITARELLEAPQGPITEAGVRSNVSVGIQYMAAWLVGSGAVPINDRMEDAATAEISRTQLWQWLNHPRGYMNDGRKITADWVQAIVQEESMAIASRRSMSLYERQNFDLAAKLFGQSIFSERFEDFLTVRGYRYLA